MKKQIYDEKNGLSYTLHGDGRTTGAGRDPDAGGT